MRIRYSLPFAGLLLVPLLGCDSNDDIKVYKVPKVPGTAQVPGTDPHAGGPTPQPGGTDPHAGVPMPTPGGADPHAGLPMAGTPGTAAKTALDGKVPAAWKPGKGSSMRLASYLVEDDDGALADISLIVLGGGAGGVLDNVNRWRAQLGLAPMDAQSFAEASNKLKTPVGEAVVVDLEASTPVGEPSRDGRIVAAIVPRASEMWFYKMRGNQELVGREKDGFLRWVESARKKKAEPAAKDPHAGVPGATPIPAPIPAPVPEAQQPKRPREISWQVPDGWKEGPAKSMRIATFAVGGESGASGEVSVIKLGGDGGGDLPNVNRWRGQIGLAPITAEELAVAVTRVDSPGGPISVIDCAGAEKRALAGWLRRDGTSWFFKLTGPTGLVETEKDHFTSFLSSVEFPSK